MKQFFYAGFGYECRVNIIGMPNGDAQDITGVLSRFMYPAPTDQIRACV